jgi:TonB family protein
MRLLFLLVGLGCGVLPLPASAQPQALTPLTFTDADYSLPALTEAEQGSVSLNLTLNAEGRVASVAIAQSSGSARLDAAAAYFAQSRWRFAPGTGTHASVTATWTLPLTPATDLYLEVPEAPPLGVTPPQPLPVAAPARAPRGLQLPPIAGNPATLPVLGDDYPLAALRVAEGGVAGVRFQVKEDGTLAAAEIAESSGARRLDDAALRAIRTRWRASPAMLAGAPVAIWRTASVAFRPITNAPPAPRCHPRPIIGDDAVLITARQVNPAQSNNPAAEVREAPRWIEVQPGGAISTAVLHTVKGWMRLSPALVSELAPYAAPEPRVCWFYDPVPFRR